jgi:hypothetical protein
MIYHLRNQSNPIVGNQFIAPATVMCLWNWNCFLILDSYRTTSIWNQLLRIRLKAPFRLSKKREWDHDRATLLALAINCTVSGAASLFQFHRRISLHQKFTMSLSASVLMCPNPVSPGRPPQPKTGTLHRALDLSLIPLVYLCEKFNAIRCGNS